MGLCLNSVASSWRNNSKFTLQDLAVGAVAGYLFNPNSNFEEDFEGRPGGQFWRGALIFAFGERDGLWYRFGNDGTGVGVGPDGKPKLKSLCTYHEDDPTYGRYKKNSVLGRMLGAEP